MLTDPPRGLGEVQAPFDFGPEGLEQAVLGGLPRRVLRAVAERLGGDAERATAIEHLVVPKTTLARRTSKLTLEESERTERLARLFAQAVATLGSEEDARSFMRRPHPELENRPPLEVSLTELGGRRVEAILHALEYGLPRLKLYRIVGGTHPVWSAEGARRFGGRWNARGQGVIYAAVAYSTAMLEVLVHANTGRPPPQSRHVVAELPEGVSVETLDPALLPGWDGSDPAIPQGFGRAWWQARRSAVLLVPSVVTKLDLNAVVNPEHPDAARIAVGAEQPVAWDKRLFARTG